MESFELQFARGSPANAGAAPLPEYNTRLLVTVSNSNAIFISLLASSLRANKTRHKNVPNSKLGCFIQFTAK
jgi:hypothetical protein